MKNGDTLRFPAAEKWRGDQSFYYRRNLQPTSIR